MWAVEYIIEDLMGFSFPFFFLLFSPLDLGLTGSVKCCKLSLSLFLAQTGPGTLLSRQSYIPDGDGQASYTVPRGCSERCAIDLKWREIT